jgi:hypothetical protein
MALLQSTNVQGTLCVNGVAVGGGKDLKYCCFTASTTWTPSQDLVDGNGVIDAVIVGGGGAGGGAYASGYLTALAQRETQGAGGSGATAIRDSFEIDSTDACTVTIGEGGQGAYNNGGNVETSKNFYSASTIGGCSSFGGQTVGGGYPGHTVWRNYSTTCCYLGRLGPGGACIGCTGGGMDSRENYPNATKSSMLGNNSGNPDRCGDFFLCTNIRMCNSCNCTCKTAATDPTRTHHEVQCCGYWAVDSSGCCSIGFKRDVSNDAGNTCGVNLWGGKEFYGGSLHTDCLYGACYAVSESVSDGYNLWVSCANHNTTVNVTANVPLNSGSGDCQFANDRYKGAGGLGAAVRICNLGTGAGTTPVITCSAVNGMKGNDGVVVLKWME